MSSLTVLMRLLLSLACGGAIGYGRSKKARDAGLRTYMLIALGATMAVLVSLYQYDLLLTVNDGEVSKFDASRMASQVIAGIGFLGAGIIIKIAHQQVRGLTTATGLFATVCLSMAVGYGFYAAALSALAVIVLVLNVMSPLEGAFKRKLRNITLSIRFRSMEDIGEISEVIKSLHAEIFDIDVEKEDSAIFILRLSHENHSHSSIMSTLAEMSCVKSVQEIIA